MAAGSSSRRGSSPWAAAVPTAVVRNSRHSAGSANWLGAAEWAVNGLLVLTLWALVASATGAGVTNASTSGAAAIGLTPASAAANATVGASGSGFSGRTLVQLTWDGNPAGMPSVQTAGNGSFKATFVVPAAAGGTTHTIAATAQASTGGNGKKPGASSSASALFTVLSLISLASPTPTPAATASPTPTVAPTAQPSPTPAPTTPAPTTTTSPAPSATAAPTAAPSAIATIAPTPVPTVAPSPMGFVTRSATQLFVGTQPYRFTGLNIYNANSRNNCWYSLGNNDDQLAASLSAIGGGQEVFRAWFFQAEATTNGTRDWAAFDHTLAVARAAGERVIPVLANQWGDCEDQPAGVYKTDDWYASGYKTVVRSGTVPYRDWVKEVATRYRNDPTILAWELMNEPENKVSYPDGACGSADTLRAWASDVSGLIKSVDANHLVSLGIIGSGQCGARGTEYQVLHSLSTIDLCSYHDYDQPTSPLPGDQWNGLLTRISQCASLGKPLYIGESGIKTADVGTLVTRATDFSQKVVAEFGAGAVGFLLWAWDDAAHGGSSAGYDIGPADPSLALLLQN